MSGFTKLFSQILDSTIWDEPWNVKGVWITMLAMADHQGRVMASIPGLARRATVSLQECETALQVFLSPDHYSQSSEFEGRRIEVIDGGWRLLNYLKYREMRDEEERREYQKKWAKSKRQSQNVDRCQELSTSVDQCRPMSTQAEAEAEEESTTPTPSASPSGSGLPPDEEKALALWREIAEPAGLPAVIKLDTKRKASLHARLKDSGWLDLFREAITYASRHPEGAWMRGGGTRPWKANLDYFLKPDAVLKTVEQARSAGTGTARASPLANGRVRRCAIADAALDVQLSRMTFQELPPIAVGAP